MNLFAYADRLDAADRAISEHRHRLRVERLRRLCEMRTAISPAGIR